MEETKMLLLPLPFLPLLRWLVFFSGDSNNNNMLNLFSVYSISFTSSLFLFNSLFPFHLSYSSCFFSMLACLPVPLWVLLLFLWCLFSPEPHQVTLHLLSSPCCIFLEVLCHCFLKMLRVWVGFIQLFYSWWIFGHKFSCVVSFLNPY